MTYRVTFTPPGSPFPECADFLYEPAARDYAAVWRALGAGDVAVIPIGGAVSRSEAVSPPRASEGRGVGSSGTESGEGR